MEKLLEFNERLSELMLTNDLTIKQLSETLKISASNICLWMKGKRNIRLDNAIKLCEYFNCSLEFLVGRSEDTINFIPHPALPFYDRLIEIMKANGVSRYRIVNDLHKSHRHFDRWKAGCDPFLQTVLDLAGFFNVTLDYFIGRER